MLKDFCRMVYGRFWSLYMGVSEFVYGRAEEKPEGFNQGGVLRID